MHLGGARLSRLEARGRAAVLGALAAFVIFQLLAALVTNHWQPQFRDVEYGRRLQYLRNKLRKQPDQPLVIVMGNSRVGAGVRPQVLTPSSFPGARLPLVFNYGLMGSGPPMELCLLQRLLGAGIHPDLVCVECWAPFFRQDETYGDYNRIDIERMS
jgi:hypothetical protein